MKRMRSKKLQPSGPVSPPPLTPKVVDRILGPCLFCKTDVRFSDTQRTYDVMRGSHAHVLCWVASVMSFTEAEEWMAKRQRRTW